MFLKKMAVTLLAVVTVISMSMTSFAANSRRSSGGGGGGGGSSSGGSSTGMRGSSQYSGAGPGAAGLAGMTEVQKLANGDAWYADANGNWKLLYANGQLAKGWVYVPWTWNGQTETKWYFFDLNTNTMLTGLTDVNGQMYYLNPISNGFKGMMETGAVNVNGQTLNFAADTGELLN